MAFYPAFIPTHALFEESKKLENKNFSKASRWEIAKTSILPTTCFKQFLCSSRLASTLGKSLSAVFVASLNFAWRHVESVITAISHFSLWSKTLHCWQKHVKINQSEGIPGSGILERTFVKNSYKRSLTSLPSPPLLFIFTLHRSPLSERLEQAIHVVTQGRENKAKTMKH